MEECNKVDSFNIKILVVDDELIARKVIAKCLDNCGYKNVQVITSGFEAYDLIKGGPKDYNLLLCDVLMPGMDGLELIKKIKLLPNTNELAIVMISGTEDLRTVYSCLKAGADDYILKPIQTSILKNLWSNVWKKRREHQIIFQLEKEKNKSSYLGKELSDLKTQMEDLHTKIDQAIDTPISIIMRTLTELQHKSNLTPDVENAISNIIQSLSTSNLYKPALFKIVENDSMDKTTKKWLIGELGFNSHLNLNLSSFSSKAATTPASSSSSSHPSSPSLSPSYEKMKEKGEEQSKLREKLRNFLFDVWQEKEEDLMDMLIFFFQDFNLLETFQIPEEKMRNFIQMIKSKYIRSNPYHNFIHAFDVTQTVYSYLTIGKAAKYLKQVEILIILVASICHDVGHPGVNNSFLSNTSHSLSIRYNDQSILENFHTCLTFEILTSSSDLNIFSNFSRNEFQAIRKAIILCILSTDLSKHVEILNRLENISGNFDKEDPDHRSLILKMLIKSADISNPAKPFQIARYWAELVQEEFFIQGDKEKENGLEVSTFMDRENYQLSKMQMGFADYFVTPLFSLMHKFLPDIKPVLDTLHDNRTNWGNISNDNNNNNNGLN